MSTLLKYNFIIVIFISMTLIICICSFDLNSNYISYMINNLNKDFCYRLICPNMFDEGERSHPCFSNSLFFDFSHTKFPRPLYGSCQVNGYMTSTFSKLNGMDEGESVNSINAGHRDGILNSFIFENGRLFCA